MAKDNDEWIKIEYDGKPAYVFAEYVEIIPMFLNDMGEYEEYVELDENGNAKITFRTYPWFICQAFLYNFNPRNFFHHYMILSNHQY